jgi:hypothetical protein
MIDAPTLGCQIILFPRQRGDEEEASVAYVASYVLSSCDKKGKEKKVVTKA